LLDPRLVDPGSTLIYVGAYGAIILMCQRRNMREAPITLIYSNCNILYESCFCGSHTLKKLPLI